MIAEDRTALRNVGLVVLAGVGIMFALMLASAIVGQAVV